jgi:IQ and AAA domain-containing protein
MSHVAYDMQLADAMNDLQEQIKVEHLPKELNEDGKPNIEDWGQSEVFSYLASLYIKYIDIYRKLEECYDQIVQPQKRVFIKKILECTISRICDIKKDMTVWNDSRQGSIYVHLDQLLFDLKYDPSVVEIPVPRYFAEDDRIELDLKFKEGVDQGGKKKKAKKAKKKGKKKKGGDEEEEEKKPEPFWLD